MAPSYSGVWKLQTKYQYNSQFPTDPLLGSKGFFAGGSASAGTSNVVDVITIESTAANATDFGDLTATRTKGFATSNHTRGLITGGEGGIASAASIDYIELASASNASDFGDLANHVAFREDGCAFANNVRAIFAGGNDNTGSGGTGFNYIDFVTIQTLGNAKDFGNLTDGLNQNAGFASTTRGISSGGYNDAGSSSNIIQYVTLATTGNATDFGDLTAARFATAGCASATRGLTAGGNDGGSNNIIDYVTITSLGNAIDFGDLTKASYYNTACSNETKGLLTAGTNNATQAVEFVTLATTSNSSDFGDLSVARIFADGFSDSTPSSALESGFAPADIGLIAGANVSGNAAGYQTTIQYVNIASSGNAVVFGDLNEGCRNGSGLGSTTRGVFALGGTDSDESADNTIEFSVFATKGKSSDFGDLTANRFQHGATSNATIGLFGGGWVSGSVNNIDKIVIASTGNATDFGDLTQQRRGPAAVSNTTTGFFAGGYSSQAGALSNIIDTVTFASAANATDFADLTAARQLLAGASSSTRGVFAGGQADTIDYITMSSASNATDFGDLTASRTYAGSLSDKTSGVFPGGISSNTTIDVISIATTANATDFGDLLYAGQEATQCASNSHGGIS